MPARFAALAEAGRSTDEHARPTCPRTSCSPRSRFLTPAQIAAAKAALEENWGPMVADA